MFVIYFQAEKFQPTIIFIDEIGKNYLIALYDVDTFFSTFFLAYLTYLFGNTFGNIFGF